MFTLRSLFFVVRNMAECFDTVKYGICTILVSVGVEMMVSEWVNVPSDIFCSIVTVLFFASLGASWINARNDRSKGTSQEHENKRPQNDSAISESSSCGSLVTTTAAQALLGERGDAATGCPEQGRGASSSGKAKTEARAVLQTGGTDKKDIWSVLDTPSHSPVVGPRKDANDAASSVQATVSNGTQEAAVTPMSFQNLESDELDITLSGERPSPKGPFTLQSDDLDITFG